jgi:hypothetical protein
MHNSPIHSAGKHSQQPAAAKLSIKQRQPEKVAFSSAVVGHLSFKMAPLPPRFTSGIKDVEPCVKPDCEPEQIRGEIFRIYDFAGFIRFTDKEGQEQIAAFTPAKMYLNSNKKNLMAMLPTEDSLRRLLVIGTVVEAVVLSCKEKFSLSFGEDAEKGVDFFFKPSQDHQSQDNGDKFVSHVVRELWPANAGDKEEEDIGKVIELSLFNLDHPLMDFNWKLIHCKPLFQRNHRHKRPGWKDVKGVIKEVWNPHGGLIEANNTIIYFDRGCLFVKNRPIGYTENLEDFVKIGQEVFFEAVACPLEHGEVKMEAFATKIHIDRDPEHPQEKCDLVSLKRCHRLKIISLDQDCIGRIVGGRCVILTSPYLRNLFNGPMYLGEVVTFTHDKSYFGGISLKDIDLAYFCKVDDVIYGPVEKVKRSVFEVLYAVVGETSLSITSRTSYNKFQDYNLDLASMERLLYNRSERMTDNIDPDKYAFCRVISLYNPGASEAVVTSGTLRVNSGNFTSQRIVRAQIWTIEFILIFTRFQIFLGPQKDNEYKFNRSAVMLHGFSLEKADLSYLFKSNDFVLIDLTSVVTPLMKTEPSLVQRVFIGPVGQQPIIGGEPDASKVIDKMPFHLFLTTHGLDWTLFVQVIEGKTSPRLFVPFVSSECFKGHICKLNVKPTIDGKAISSGLIMIDDEGFDTKYHLENGKAFKDMKGQLVAFNRDCLWIHGIKIVQGDLAYLLGVNQNVSLEIEANDGLEEDHVIYKATMVYIGSERPRHNLCDKETSRSEPDLCDFVTKRKLTMNVFQDIIQGKHPPVESALLDTVTGFYLSSKPLLESSQDAEQPVLRHGLDLANMLEVAVTSSGPDDPFLMNLIKNDEMAQNAHHIAQALQCALDNYRQSQLRPSPVQDFGVRPLMDNNFDNFNQRPNNKRSRFEHY